MASNKVKCSLFSEDGKLISPSDPVKSSNNDTVTKELAALKSTDGLKNSMFSEDGRLKGSTTPTKSDELRPDITVTESNVSMDSVEEQEIVATWTEEENVNDVDNNKIKGETAVTEQNQSVPVNKDQGKDIDEDDDDDDDEEARIKLLDGLDYLDDLLDNVSVDPGDEELLKWSSDTPHHLSDFFIGVKNQQDGSKVRYYVHKLVLSTGPTKCGLFEKMFSTSKDIDGKTIVLSHSAAKSFPELLDFLYSREDSLDLDSENAAALRHLGKLLLIKKLVMRVTLYIRDDLKAQMSLHYLNSAFEFMDEHLMDNAAKVCAANILAVDRDGLTSLDPYLFSKVVLCDVISCTSEELSKIVSEFCRKHSAEMNKDLLRVVTGSKNMPVVDYEECVYLLQLAEKYDTDAGGEADLKERCILAGSQAWNKTIVQNLNVEPEEAGPYDKLTAELKVKLLEDALLQANLDYGKILSNQNKAVEEIKTEADNAVRMKETSVNEVLTKAKNLETENKALRKELYSFKRLPADFKFPKTRNQYSYHPSGDAKFGKEKPTVRPSHLKPDGDAGIVVVEGKFVYPVFAFQPSEY